MPKTLVVIDMQPSFQAANSPQVIVGVTKQILEAKLNNWPIVVLEYDQCGSTHPALISLLKGYKHKSVITKKDDDGSKELIKCLQRRKFPESELLICGVNADCCVITTIYGILNKLTNTIIELSKEACATELGDIDWRRFPKHSRLSLV